MKNKIKFGDVVYFKENTVVYTSDDNWLYTKNIQRIIFPDEPLIYYKCKKHYGKLYHYFTSLGLKYVFCGSYENFKYKYLDKENDASQEKK